jgi:hypothetical protein
VGVEPGFPRLASVFLLPRSGERHEEQRITTLVETGCGCTPRVR